jgi:Cu-Zn family superoxide dismutase
MIQKPLLLVLVGLGPVLLAGGRQEQIAVAKLKGAEDKVVGSATLVEDKDGVHIKIIASGLPPGLHGFHIHEKGACDSPKFESSGGHFNPYGKKHGLKNKQGPHAGDLPNLPVNELGVAEFTAHAKLVTLGPGKNSLFEGAGTCLVIHAGQDDEMSDPAGNSGARLACGVIEKP